MKKITFILLSFFQIYFVSAQVSNLESKICAFLKHDTLQIRVANADAFNITTIFEGVLDLRKNTQKVENLISRKTAKIFQKDTSVNGVFFKLLWNDSTHIDYANVIVHLNGKSINLFSDKSRNFSLYEKGKLKFPVKGKIEVNTLGFSTIQNVNFENGKAYYIYSNIPSTIPFSIMPSVCISTKKGKQTIKYGNQKYVFELAKNNCFDNLFLR